MGKGTTKGIASSIPRKPIRDVNESVDPGNTKQSLCDRPSKVENQPNTPPTRTRLGLGIRSWNCISNGELGLVASDPTHSIKNAGNACSRGIGMHGRQSLIGDRHVSIRVDRLMRGKSQNYSLYV